MSRLSIVGMVFVALGIISGFIQQRYYGYMDAEGVIHDSLFLPLAAILILSGGALLLISMLRFLIRRHRK